MYVCIHQSIHTYIHKHIGIGVSLFIDLYVYTYIYICVVGQIYLSHVARLFVPGEDVRWDHSLEQGCIYK